MIYFIFVNGLWLESFLIILIFFFSSIFVIPPVRVAEVRNKFIHAILSIKMTFSLSIWWCEPKGKLKTKDLPLIIELFESDPSDNQCDFMFICQKMQINCLAINQLCCAWKLIYLHVPAILFASVALTKLGVAGWSEAGAKWRTKEIHSDNSIQSVIFRSFCFLSQKKRRSVFLKIRSYQLIFCIEIQFWDKTPFLLTSARTPNN